MLAFVAMLFLPFVLLAQNLDKVYGSVLSESFENVTGVLPEGWTQVNVNSDINWVIESGEGLSYPKGAFDGAKRIAFRNTTGVTKRAVTRLILPAVDVSELFEPILVFSHAQDKWTGDYDTLRVLYRGAADAEWTQIFLYDSYIAKWTTNTIKLPMSEYCQIAFEAIDNLGRGVVLDDINIRSTPSCFKPYGFAVTSISNDSIDFMWDGSYDAISFDVKVSKTQLTKEELNSSSLTGLVLDTVTKSIFMGLDNLEAGKTYYCYIKSNCEDEVSDWYDTTLVTPNVIKIPYYQDFNLPQTLASVPSYLNGWYSYSTSDGLYKPYVNTNASQSLASYTKDGSYSLVFTQWTVANYTSNVGIPAGQTSYVSLPEVTVPVNSLQLSFESVFRYPHLSDRSSIIVGVMSIQDDFSTFEAVDTVNITTPFVYDEYTVSFENYDGNGKFITFLSDFAETNIFAIDNLAIEERPAVSKVNFDVIVPSATSITLDFLQSYSSYEVMVADMDLDANEKQIAESAILAQGTISDLGSIENIPSGRYVYVYARAIKGENKGLWSNAKRVRMPKKIEVDNLPYVINFNTREAIAVHDFLFASLTPELLPMINIVNNSLYISDSIDVQAPYGAELQPAPRSRYELCMSSNLNLDNQTSVVVLPEVDLTSTMFAFYAARRDGYSYPAVFYVGFVADARDMNSFVAIDTIMPNNYYSYHEYDLSKYVDPKHKLLAFKIDNFGGAFGTKTSGNYLNECFIDDIVFSKASPCKSPIEIEVTAEGSVSENATISWNANGSSKWAVKVAKSKYNQATFDTATTYNFIFDQEVTTPSIQLSGLEYPNVEYFYWIKPICEGITVDWLEPRSFRTECKDVYTIPYTQNFDSFIAGDKQSVFAGECLYTSVRMKCDLNSWSESTPLEYLHFYPYFSSKNAFVGKSLVFGPNTTQSGTNKIDYIAFPKMNVAPENLQISFKAMTTTGMGHTIGVAVVSDPNNLNLKNLTAIQTVSAGAHERGATTNWKEYVLSLKSSKPLEGEYIVLYQTEATTDSIFIDDIVIDYAPNCNAPTAVKTMSTSSPYKVEWTPAKENPAGSYIVLVTNESFDVYDFIALENNFDSIRHSILMLDTVNQNYINVTDDGETESYYVYVRGYCDGRVTPWTAEYRFQATCAPQSIDTFKEEFKQDDATTPQCWTVASSNDIVKETGLLNIATKYTSKISNQRLYFEPRNKGSLAVTPPLVVDDFTKYKMKISLGVAPETDKTAAGADHARALIVAIATNPLDHATFVPVDTVTNISAEMRPYEVYLESYTGTYEDPTKQGKYLVLWSNFDKDNGVYIDDISFAPITNCPRFILESSTATSNSITLNLSSIPASYDVKYSTALATDKELNGPTLPSITAITSSQVVVSGLQPNTNYYFYARPTKDKECQTWSVPIVVSTAGLDEVSLPFSDDFETNVDYGYAGATPDNWHGLYIADQDNSYPYVTESSVKLHADVRTCSGTKAVLMSTRKNLPNYLVSPKLIVEDPSKLYLSFNISALTYTNTKNSKTTGIAHCIVGVVSDLNNIDGTFVPVDTVFGAAKGCTACTVNFENYKGSGKYIAFKADQNYMATKVSSASPTATDMYFYVDKVAVEELQSCMRPTSVALKTVTDNSMVITFDHEKGAPKYEVKYGLKGFDLAKEGTSIEVTEKTATLTSLLANTEYDIYVRALCTETDYSFWTDVESFATLGEVVTSFPHVVTFDDAEEAGKWGFTTNIDNNKWVVGVDSARLVADKLNDTDKALYISGDNGLSPKNKNLKNIAWAYRFFEFKEGVYTISFDWVCPGTRQNPIGNYKSVTHSDYIRAGLVPATAVISGSKVTSAETGGSIDMLQSISSQYDMPEGWIELSNSEKIGLYEYTALMGTDLALPLADQWQTKSSNIVITKELEGSYRLVFFWYGNTITEDGVRAAAIDNISIVKSDCTIPYNVAVDDCAHDGAEISWSVFGSAPANFEVCVLNAEVNPDKATQSQIVSTQTVTNAKLSIKDLVPETEYYVYVRSICSANDKSLWSNPLKFKTYPGPFPEGYVFSFEEEGCVYAPPFVDECVGHINGSSSTKTSLFHKWFTRTKTTSEADMAFVYISGGDNLYEYYPTILKNRAKNTTKIFARTGEHALYFSDAIKNNTAYHSVQNMTVAMPYVGSLENSRLVFYMRTFHHTYGNKGATLTTQFTIPTRSGTYNRFAKDAGNSQVRGKITVGVMSDPNDPTTFVAIDTVEYLYNSKTKYTSSQNLALPEKDPSGDDGWWQAVVDLEKAQGKGKFIAFRLEKYDGVADNRQYASIYIDDISVVPTVSCDIPRNIAVKHLKARSAEVEFDYESSPNFLIEVTSVADGSVITDTVSNKLFNVEGLSPLTEYNLRIKALCNILDTSEWSQTITFKTPTEVRFDANFDNDTLAMNLDGWIFAHYPIYDILFTQNQFPQTYTPNATTKYGWLACPPLFNDGMFSTYHMSMKGGDDTYKFAYLFTPIINLKDNEDQHLVFDLARTGKGENGSVSESYVGDFPPFSVLISDDGGASWKLSNTISWGDNQGTNYDYSYEAIPNTGKQYKIDLSKYKGKNIQVGFCYFTQLLSSEIHIDNVHINTYARKNYSGGDLCEYIDYEDDNFFVVSDEMNLGLNKFDKLMLTYDDSQKDTILTVEINVCEVKETVLNDNICEGKVYNENGFTGLTSEGVYKRKLGSSTKCDSIVTLHLGVIPTIVTREIDTICFGSKRIWNGEEYTRTGTYTKTLTSEVTGCDSIATLILTVEDILRYDEYVNVCFGGEYVFGDQTITKSGNFEEVFKTADGCDSLVTIHVTVLPDYRDTIYDVAVLEEGETYSKHGFKGLTADGVYTLPLKSVDGCDSTLTLHLNVIKDVSAVDSITLCFGAEYEFGSQTISKSGNYTETFKTTDGADSIVLLTVTVLPDYRQTIDTTICAGEAYNEYGFENITTSGVHLRKLTSVEGCDSTITLNLTVLTGDTTRIEKRITTDELPYEYKGLYYDKSTLPDTYVDTIVIKTGNCEEVIIHTLIVELADAIDNVNTVDLVMVPNPVAVNGTIYINAEFSAEERDGMRVEVFNAIGQCVYVDTPSIYPIEIGGLQERGMYIVRIVTGNGKCYSDKLIVE